MKNRSRIRVGLVASVACAALTGGIPSAFAVDEPEGTSALSSEELASVDVEISDPAGGEITATNFTSSMTSWATGKKSTSWSDQDYTELVFTGCSATNGSPNNLGTSMHIRLWQYALGPDDDLGEKKFTNCFNSGSSISRGEWNFGNGKHSRWFTLEKINSLKSSDLRLTVKKVYVDTTKAD
ncbi:hypothetical protein ACF1A9_18835 [Streptomyces sp. NPDC014872]|uniref:hypothetical protein n=1 Tax=Streptomyces sp. NPDC014872 TaxID=3364926 RepID=UPI0036FC4069